MTKSLISQFRAELDKAKQRGKERSGARVLKSEHGPVSYSVIEGLLQIIESQQKEIDEIRGMASSAQFNSM